MTEKNLRYEHREYNENRINITGIDCECMNEIKHMSNKSDEFNLCKPNGISENMEMNHHTECEAVDLSAGTELEHHTECEAMDISAGSELKRHTECEAGCISAGTETESVGGGDGVDRR